MVLFKKIYDCFDIIRCWVLKKIRGCAIFKKMLLILKDINGNVLIFKEKAVEYLYKKMYLETID